MDVVGPGEQVVEEILLHWAIDSGGGRCRREGRCRVGEGGTFLGDTHRGVVRLGEGDVTSLLNDRKEEGGRCRLHEIREWFRGEGGAHATLLPVSPGGGWSFLQVPLGDVGRSRGCRGGSGGGTRP